jgi:hypothetical protein
VHDAPEVHVDHVLEVGRFGVQDAVGMDHPAT